MSYAPVLEPSESTKLIYGHENNVMFYVLFHCTLVVVANSITVGHVQTFSFLYCSFVFESISSPKQSLLMHLTVNIDTCFHIPSILLRVL